MLNETQFNGTEIGGDGNTPTFNYPDSTSTAWLKTPTTTGTGNFTSSATVTCFLSGFLENSVTGQSFSNVRSGAGGVGSQTLPEEYVAIGANPDPDTDKWATLTRVPLYFTLSNILSGGVTITAATLGLYITTRTDALTQNLSVSSVTTSSNSALAGADFAVANYGSTEFLSSPPTIGSLTLSAYNTLTLNASALTYLNATSGVCKLAVRTSADRSNVSPTWVTEAESSAQIDGFDSSYPPILTLTLSVPMGTATSWTKENRGTTP